MTPKTTEQQEEYNRLVEAIESIGRQGVFEEDDEEDFLEWEEGDHDES